MRVADEVTVMGRGALLGPRGELGAEAEWGFNCCWSLGLWVTAKWANWSARLWTVPSSCCFPLLLPLLRCS